MIKAKKEQPQLFRLLLFHFFHYSFIKSILGEDHYHNKMMLLFIQ